MNNNVIKIICIVAFIVIAVGLAFGIGNKLGHKYEINNSGDEKSGEYVSGDELTDEEFVAWIDSYIAEMGEITRENSTILNKEVTDLELGVEAKEYMEGFETDSVSAEVLKHTNNAIMIVPAPDFLDIQSFYYSGDNLVLYKREFIGIGGEASYYFRDGKKIAVKTEVEEEMNFEEEKAEDILKRAMHIRDSL